MKKIYICMVTLLAALALGGCSSNDPKASLTFFKALNSTWTEDTLHLTGTLDIDASYQGVSDMELWLDQTKEPELMFTMDLDAYGTKIPDFLDFYIKDGKTYLDAAGTKSQSVTENIGLKKGDKLSVWDPFLSLTDKEKEQLFTKATVNGDQYHFELDKHALGVYLDEMGGAAITTATVDATIQDDRIQTLKLDVAGTQKIDGKSQNISLKADIQVQQAGGKVNIPFPADLDSFGK